MPAYVATPPTMVPSEPEPDTVILPPLRLIVVLPEYVFAPDNVSLPVPDFCNAPVPDTTPAYSTSLLRLKIKFPEFTTLCVAIQPFKPPAPTLTVPVEIVNAPSKVLVPLSVRVPLPCFSTEPAADTESDIAPENVLVASPARVNLLFVDPVLLRTIEPIPSIDATVSSRLARSNVAPEATDTAEEFEMRSGAVPIASVPADTVVGPVYVLSPDIVNVPVPCFVMPSDEPEIAPEIVPEPLLTTPIVEVVPSVTGPAALPAAEKYNAPLVDVVPFSVSGSLVVTAAATSSVAPKSTVVLCPAAEPPSALAWVIFRVPVETVVVPVYSLAFDNVNVLLADVFFVNVPEPEITPDNV